MRGKLDAVAVLIPSIRITPAHAGKTLQYALQHRAVQDHPRGCGENSWYTFCMGQRPGSPPRMRGKPLFSALGGNNSRITPADAGKTASSIRASASSADHPRGCGENFDGLIIHPKQIGSPPRMRGKQYIAALVRKLFRITPADAGKTLLLFRWVIVCPDHPRGCGENKHTP